eukprot:2738047-Pyramimonas_sp.AAC.1
MIVGVVGPLRPLAPWWPPLSGAFFCGSLRWLHIYRPGVLWPDGLYEARRGGGESAPLRLVIIYLIITLACCALREKVRASPLARAAGSPPRRRRVAGRPAASLAIPDT